MSKASDVLKAGDEMILERGARDSGIVDYSIGRQVSVSYRGGNRYLCHTCVKVSDCEHATRVQRYREEHQEALNFVMADPATEVPIA